MPARGFTLLEVLIALLVLALALVALTRTAGVEVAAFADTRERTLAGWLAEDLLAEARLRGFPPTGRSNGTRRFADRDWRWETRIAATDVPTLRRIDVRVWSDAARDHPLAQLGGFAGGDLAP